MNTSKFSELRTIEEVRLALRDALVPKYGEREAAAMARLAVMTIKGWDLPHLLADGHREASPFVKGRAAEILDALEKDMPIQYALGETSFYGLRLAVRPGVLIPRPETEELVDIIVKENKRPDLRVLDFCTGSGAIALALARSLPFSAVEAIDISPEALAVAEENAKALKAKVDFRLEDVFTFEIRPDSFDIIVSNPPYVDESEKKDMEPNVLGYEPSIALFVPDSDPLLFYRRIARLAAEGLVAGGRLYLEINPRHAGDLSRLLENGGFAEVEVLRDFNRRDRFITATKPKG